MLYVKYGKNRLQGSREDAFEKDDEWWTTDAYLHVYYKLTNEPSAQVSKNV